MFTHKQQNKNSEQPHPKQEPLPLSQLPHQPTSTHRTSTEKSAESPNKGKYTGCNCAKSQCLKMYCACFSVGKMCDQTCLCESCKNCTDNMDRSEAISEVIDRDPHAFSRKTTQVAELSKTVCNCLKSACKKKYCDCYRSGKQCGSNCQCKGCLNNQNEEEISESLPSKAVKLT